MLVKDAYGEAFHLNPSHVVMAYTTKTGEDYAIDLPSGETMWLDRDSYQRLIVWLEQAR